MFSRSVESSQLQLRVHPHSCIMFSGVVLEEATIFVFLKMLVKLVMFSLHVFVFLAGWLGGCF